MDLIYFNEILVRLFAIFNIFPIKVINCIIRQIINTHTHYIHTHIYIYIYIYIIYIYIYIYTHTYLLVCVMYLR